MSEAPKTALITGSGRNIGRAIAIHLGRAGYNVALNGSSDRAACEEVAGAVQAAGGQARVVMGNVGVREEAFGIAVQTGDAAAIALAGISHGWVSYRCGDTDTALDVLGGALDAAMEMSG